MTVVNPWTKEEDAFLTDAWKKGLSTAEIALALERAGLSETVRSRNAIIGRSSRLSLPMHSKARERSKEPKVKAIARLKPAPKAQPKPKAYLVGQSPEALDERRVEMTKQGKGLLARLEALPVNDNAKPLMELGRYECRWPEGTPSRPSQQLCCGARVMLGEADAPLPYCAHHHAMAYTGKPKVSGVSRFHTRPGERRHVATVWDAGRAA
jgi:hypothetical protein